MPAAATASTPADGAPTPPDHTLVEASDTTPVEAPDEAPPVEAPKDSTPMASRESSTPAPVSPTSVGENEFDRAPEKVSNVGSNVDSNVGSDDGAASRPKIGDLDF